MCENNNKYQEEGHLFKFQHKYIVNSTWWKCIRLCFTRFPNRTEETK